ncbi:hypothetical protein RSOLAG22IIIB_10376 [Rhizoctonia solani]|uniref:MYND-type domain-containing protein n=1 Tax=Rhizoctonia solani TaxID=456999 RepID=A0A0K6G3E4_9AGAM|nr:hypothetical protein RSOLAG22IIIB_10376 [Rhizoctonia solani]
MSTALNNDRHAFWGLPFPDYFELYTNQALAVPLSPSEETNVLATATKTIELIIALSDLPEGSRQEATGYITLSMLKSILDATKIPKEIKKLADPRLVAGCMELMASVEPLFGYEYGYICFRILNLAANACILKVAGRLDSTIRQMEHASDDLLLFWSNSAAEVYSDLKRRAMIALVLCNAFTLDAVGGLIHLLHANQKQYFILLKELQSMGLSGLMFVLRAYIQIGGVLVAAPDFVPNEQDTTERLCNIAAEFYEGLVYVAPRSYLVLRLEESGALADWYKYANHFFGAGDALRAPTNSALRSIPKACGQVIIQILLAIHDKKHVNELYSIGGSCDNPRCPTPYDAAYICSECVDLVYCGVRCLAADWASLCQGLHKRVCQHQAVANPKSRPSYHRSIRDLRLQGMDIVRRGERGAENIVENFPINYNDLAP